MKREAIQLAPGSIGSLAASADFEYVHFRRTTYNVSVSKTVGSDQKLTFAYLRRQAGPARIDGRLWLNRRLAVIAGRAEFSTTGPAILMVMEADVQKLPILDQLIGASEETRHWLSMLPAGSSLARQLERRIDECIADPRSLSLDLHRMQRVAALAFRATELAMLPEHRCCVDAQRQQFVEASKSYMWTNIGGNIGLREVSKAVGCSPRTLSNYYRSLYGVSPISYLKMLRFSRVREALRQNGTLTKAIFDVAADFGFWHMGHFSQQYRYLFGETPSETQRGARAQLAGVP